jgi:hypothetical protein
MCTTSQLYMQHMTNFSKIDQTTFTLFDSGKDDEFCYQWYHKTHLVKVI